MTDKLMREITKTTQSFETYQSDLYHIHYHFISHLVDTWILEDQRTVKNVLNVLKDEFQIYNTASIKILTPVIKDVLEDLK